LYDERTSLDGFAAAFTRTASRRARQGRSRAQGAGRGEGRPQARSLREVLAEDSEAVRKMTVRALLESLPVIGKVRAQKILTEMEISDSRRVRGLGIQQRERLLERFAAKG
jgi:hypothetical protein